MCLFTVIYELLDTGILYIKDFKNLNLVFCCMKSTDICKKKNPLLNESR